MTQDNTTLRRKVSLRLAMLGEITADPDFGEPVILETHGGYGRIWAECYPEIARGIVFEKEPERAAVLAKQRPTWAVYEADCERAIRAGAGDHLCVNVIDCDPYGDPWPVLDAFFAGDRPWARRMHVVVNDGVRKKLRYGLSRPPKQLAEATLEHGIGLNARYLEVCEELLQEKAVRAGYRLDRFGGYHCGNSQLMTHYRALLVRD